MVREGFLSQRRRDKEGEGQVGRNASFVQLNPLFMYISYFPHHLSRSYSVFATVMPVGNCYSYLRFRMLYISSSSQTPGPPRCSSRAAFLQFTAVVELLDTQSSTLSNLPFSPFDGPSCQLLSRSPN